jgi:chorismate-pyruvate lyase
MAMFASVPAQAVDAHAWPDTYLGRLETFALIEELNGELLASSSATTTLETWCADHRMAVPARITATVVRGSQSPASAQDRAMLEAAAGEPVRFRRVLLACGDHVLSQAENWYVPSRLTPDMNRTLDTTGTPFGRVIAPLKPSRQTLSVERLWLPLPAGWETAGTHFVKQSGGNLAIPLFLFRHRAVVRDGAHRPIALVVETYTNGVLDFVR